MTGAATRDPARAGARLRASPDRCRPTSTQNSIWPAPGWRCATPRPSWSIRVPTVWPQARSRSARAASAPPTRSSRRPIRSTRRPSCPTGRWRSSTGASGRSPGRRCSSITRCRRSRPATTRSSSPATANIPVIPTAVLMRRVEREAPLWLAEIGIAKEIGADHVSGDVRQLAALVDAPRRVPGGPVAIALELLTRHAEVLEALADHRVAELDDARRAWKAELERVIRIEPEESGDGAVVRFDSEYVLEDVVARSLGAAPARPPGHRDPQRQLHRRRRPGPARSVVTPTGACATLVVVPLDARHRSRERREGARRAGRLPRGRRHRRRCSWSRPTPTSCATAASWPTTGSSSARRSCASGQLASEMARRGGVRGRVLSRLQRERVAAAAIAAAPLDVLRRSAADRAGSRPRSSGSRASSSRGASIPARFTSALRTWAAGTLTRGLRRGARGAVLRLPPRAGGDRRAATTTCAWRRPSTHCARTRRAGAPGRVRLRVRRPAPAAARGRWSPRSPRAPPRSRVADLRAGPLRVRRPHGDGAGAAPARRPRRRLACDPRPLRRARAAPPRAPPVRAAGDASGSTPPRRSPRRDQLMEGGGERAELELVAAEVARLIRRRRRPPEEIAIVARDVAAIAPRCCGRVRRRRRADRARAPAAFGAHAARRGARRAAALRAAATAPPRTC